MILPVHPLRHEDVELVDRWIRARSGFEPEPITIAALYKSDNAPPQQFWAAETCKNSRRWLLTFARRCRVPLREVGLLPNGTFTTASVRDEIQTYAADYAARHAGRLEALSKLIAEDEQKKHRHLLPWRTAAWTLFVRTGTEFYNWLERQGLRPRGSNPFLDIVRLPGLPLKREVVIVEAWYQKIFSYPKSPKQQAVIMLLANGLRCSEVAQAKAGEFTLSQDGPSTLRILGKGNKVRVVYLYDKTAAAVYYWLRSRLSASPWLFPGKKAGQPCTESSIYYLVIRLCEQVFPSPEEERIRRRISPHKFRHFFTSDALHRGMNPSVVIAQLGHSGGEITKRYAHLDPEWIRQEIQAIDKGDRYVARNGGPPRVLRSRSGDNDDRQRDVPLW